MQAYLDSVPANAVATSTCLERDVWWRFSLPPVPVALVATCFKGRVPKAVRNTVGAIAVGGVAGIHDVDSEWARAFLLHFASLGLDERIVAHANGLRKVEINQLNTLLAEFDGVTASDV